MKNIACNIILILLFVGLFSCEKDKFPNIIQSADPDLVYHISFYDHKSGKKITGLEASLITYDWGNGYRLPDIVLNSDASGDIRLSNSKRSNFNQYIKIANQNYVEALYEINERSISNTQPVHTKEGSNGSNVVKAEFLKKIENDFYFKADLYLKVAVDIHVIQLADYSDSLSLHFNATIDGTDPANTVNNFGTTDIFGEGIHLNPGKKLDTTVKVFAFGDYLNTISWKVYENVFLDTGLDEQGKRIISVGKLEEKIFPSDVPAKITITF